MAMSAEQKPSFSKEEFITGFGLEPGELTDALFDYTNAIQSEWEQRKIGRRRFAETIVKILETGDSEGKTKAIEALILSIELPILIDNLMRH